MGADSAAGMAGAATPPQDVVDNDGEIGFPKVVSLQKVRLLS